MQLKHGALKYTVIDIFIGTSLLILCNSHAVPHGIVIYGRPWKAKDFLI
jgi:hypothetical protein